MNCLKIFFQSFTHEHLQSMGHIQFALCIALLQDHSVLSGLVGGEQGGTSQLGLILTSGM